MSQPGSSSDHAFFNQKNSKITRDMAKIILHVRKFFEEEKEEKRFQLTEC